MKWLILLGIISFVNSDSLPDTTSTAQSFCDMSTLCSHGTKSIACSYTSDTNMECEGTMIPIDKDLILEVHNNHRQKIASGNVPQYESATNILEMEYDYELEMMASYNAKRCRFAHDDCRKTNKYPHAGQNIANQKQSNGDFDFTTAFTEMMDSWFDEYKVGDMSFINSYHSSSEVVVGHFTQMVKDKASSVGCAASNYMDGDWNVLYLVCNYAYTNMRGEATYIAGPPGSDCEQNSEEYPALCTS